MSIPFKPFECTKSGLDALAIQNGYMYLITDNGQLAFDVNNERIIIDKDKVTKEEVNVAISEMANDLRAASYDITLLTSGWIADTTYPGYGYKYAYALSIVTADTIAELLLDVQSVKVATNAGMLSATETVTGYVNFYAENVPDSNLTGTLLLSSEIPLGSTIEGFDPSKYVQVSMIGAASGVASLGSDGKVPTMQLPAMDYIPNSKLGTASGVATLGTDGKVPSSQLPSMGGHIASSTAPSNTNLLWIDTGNGGILKYYSSGNWVAVASVWG